MIMMMMIVVMIKGMMMMRDDDDYGDIDGEVYFNHRVITNLTINQQSTFDSVAIHEKKSRKDCEN